MGSVGSRLSRNAPVLMGRVIGLQLLYSKARYLASWCNMLLKVGCACCGRGGGDGKGTRRLSREVKVTHSRESLRFFPVSVSVLAAGATYLQKLLFNNQKNVGVSTGEKEGAG